MSYCKGREVEAESKFHYNFKCVYFEVSLTIINGVYSLVGLQLSACSVLLCYLAWRYLVKTHRSSLDNKIKCLQ